MFVAAIEATASGARVLLLERAPEHLRGGNSRHTRNIRYLHDERTAYVTGPYRRDEFLDDLLRVGGGHARIHPLIIPGREHGISPLMNTGGTIRTI